VLMLVLVIVIERCSPPKKPKRKVAAHETRERTRKFSETSVSRWWQQVLACFELIAPFSFALFECFVG